MLVVETYLAPDAYGGTGLFSRNPIKKGTVIWQHDDRCDQFFTIGEYHALHPAFRKVVSHYGYRARVDGIDGIMLSQDNDRYMNHSDSPNIMCHYATSGSHSGTDSRYYVCIAGTDIPEGTEITMDYRGLDLPGISSDTYREVATCTDFLLGS